jgi:NDP-sugar pyrophosphorylase family protein
LRSSNKETKEQQVQSDIITNKALFDLNNKNNNLNKPLQEFLESEAYPWQLLGAKLTTFLTELINSVPINQRLQGVIHPLAVLSGSEIVVESGATVEAGAFIEGPSYICEGAVVRHGAYVRGQVYAGKKTVIGHTTEVKGSILLPEAKAAHFAYLGNSILGIDVNLGAGTKLANLRFDHGNVIIRQATSDGKNQTYNTDLKKLGAILGNSAQTGCNSVTNPGTILTAGSYLKPLELGSGIVNRKMPQIRRRS